MPIKVTCQCGKTFAAKDELAGKAVKCPNCQKPLRIPAAAQPAAPAAAAPKKPAAKPAAPQPAAAPKRTSDTDDVFDELGLAPQEAGARPCPGCGSALAENAVVCIHCGYNTKLGRRMETVKIGKDEGPTGHGAVSTDLLNRAAQTIDEDKQEDIKKTKSGAPWWVWLIVFVLVVGFLTYMIIRANREEAKPKEPTTQFSPRNTPTRSVSEGPPSSILPNAIRAAAGIRTPLPSLSTTQRIRIGSTTSHGGRLTASVLQCKTQFTIQLLERCPSIG